MTTLSRDIELEKRIDAYIKGKLNKTQFLHLLQDLASHPIYLELLETELKVKEAVQYRLDSQAQQDSCPLEHLWSYEGPAPFFANS